MDDSTELGDEEIILLSTSTLSHFIGNEDKREQIEKLFELLLTNIKEKVRDEEKRVIYGKTLFGVDISIDIEEWTYRNLENIRSCRSYDCLLKLIWPIMKKHINNKTFKKVEDKDILLDLLIGWSEGYSYKLLFDMVSNSGAKLQSEKQTRNINLGHLIELCDNAFSFDASLIISAVTDVVEFLHPREDTVSENLKTLQKKVKYGLPNKSSIIFYELGFSDRVISQDLSENFQGSYPTRSRLIRGIKKRYKEITRILSKYPSYYQSVMSNIFNVN
ncbi:hypothetical protein ACGTN9_17515 [Halobacillus sp. MO56]